MSPVARKRSPPARFTRRCSVRLAIGGGTRDQPIANAETLRKTAKLVSGTTSVAALKSRHWSSTTNTRSTPSTTIETCAANTRNAFIANANSQPHARSHDPCNAASNVHIWRKGYDLRLKSTGSSLAAPIPAPPPAESTSHRRRRRSGTGARSPRRREPAGARGRSGHSPAAAENSWAGESW